MPNKLKNIFVHCSSSPWGEVMVFDEWHKKRGWSGVGYHYIILNGRPFADVDYWEFLDGQIEAGRRLDDDPIFEDGEIGAHVAGRNSSSIGVCLVGKKEFTDKQLEKAKSLLLTLVAHFDLTIDDVLGHYEDPNTNKTCPNLPMEYFRNYLKDVISLYDLQDAIAHHIKGIFG
jgi:N-acetylmuramoyl-L-alanine amidase